MARKSQHRTGGRPASAGISIDWGAAADSTAAIVLGIDPGTEKSAAVLYVNGAVSDRAYLDNDRLLALLHDLRRFSWLAVEAAIETIESFGMPVGAEVFATCIWIGRFVEALGADRCHLVPRSAVKQHFCHSIRAKDANIRQALLDRFGGRQAKGTKRQPGPLYGISSHCWSALAVAIYHADRQTSQTGAAP